eukprot:TRINITY_DN21578_c0_g1_i1.p1 TRINITY_DN21578_c0_g1~~TRINITY_DN21578_c0_g1_i1.p1  ORF type:complete len:472 (+),score=130.31 TRINITY_DN21578_c0_g1_i1:133-1548(+)
MRTINVSSIVKVFVTRADTFVTSWAVRYLLEEGFTVVVAATGDSAKLIEELRDKHEGRATVVGIDLLKDDVILFDEAVAGCEYMVHDVGDTEASLPLMRKVLDACATTPSMKRLVLNCSHKVLFSSLSEKEDHWVYGEADMPASTSYESEAEQFAWQRWRELGMANPKQEQPRSVTLINTTVVKQDPSESLGANFNDLTLVGVTEGTVGHSAGLQEYVGCAIVAAGGRPITNFSELAAYASTNTHLDLTFEQFQDELAVNTLNPHLKPRKPAAHPYEGPRPHFGLTSVVSPHPVGPPVSSKAPLNDVMDTIRKVLCGGMQTPRVGINIVDVRDIAKTFMLTILHEVAEGRRYIVSNQSVWLPHLMELVLQDVNRFCGNVILPTPWWSLPTNPMACLKRMRYASLPASLLPFKRTLPFFSNDLVRTELGVTVTSLSDIIADMVLGLVLHGFVEDTSGPPPVEEEEDYYYYFS